MMVIDNEDKAFWFVMRDLKRSNAKSPVYKYLQELGFEVFVPMRIFLIVKQGKRILSRKPVVQDLLFVHTTRDRLDSVVRKIPTLQYRYIRGGTFQNPNPMTVRDKDMERFMHAVNVSDDFKYYQPGELTSDMCGRAIRIVGGPLNGFEGKLVTVRGSKVKRLLVELQGFFSVGVKVAPEYIQLL